MFFRGGRHEGPFQKGDLKYVILDLIKDKPRYGYEIMRALEERSSGFYTPSPGVVYPNLQMLEEMGCISASEHDGKRVYAITGEGVKYLEERKGLADEVKSHMRHCWDHENAGVMAATMKELRVIERLTGNSLRQEDSGRVKRISEVILKARREIEAILEE